MEEDADRFARAMKARPVDDYAGWTTQRGFVLDAAARAHIDRILAETDPRTHRKPK